MRSWGWLEHSAARVRGAMAASAMCPARRARADRARPPRAGQSSTMTGTYTGQFVMSGFLDLHLRQWQRISITRAVAIAPTLLIALVYRHRRGTELDQLNELVNVLQSIQLPFALLPVPTMTSSAAVMGAAFVNRPAVAAAAWAIAAAVRPATGHGV